MLQKIEYCNLIIGETYYIKNHITRFSIGKAKMIRYKDESTGIICANFGNCLIHLGEWNFYRYVSHEEYKNKIKEKYDSTCVAIILKRIVNESFTW